MSSSFYEELLARDIKKYPEKYKGFVEVKKGKIVQEDFTTSDAKKTKKLTTKPYKEFNFQKPYIAPTKLCAHCGNKFEKPVRMGYRRWTNCRYCTSTCRTLSKAK